MIDLGYIVVSCLPVFRADVRRWFRRDLADQPWADFVDAFTTAHQELCETNALLDEIGYQSANAMVSQMASQVVKELGSNANLLPGVPFSHQAPVDTPTPGPNAIQPPISRYWDDRDRSCHGSHVCHNASQHGSHAPPVG